MHPLIIGGLISWAVNLGIGLFVYFNNPKRKVNRRFAFFNVCIGSWSLGSFLLNIIPDKTIAIWILRLSYLFGILLVPTFLSLVYVLIGEAINNKIKLASRLFSVFLIFMLPSHLFIKAIYILPKDGLLISSPGPIYYIFACGFGIAAYFGFSKLISAIKLSSGGKRNQLKYISVAYFIATIAGLDYFLSVFRIFEGFPIDDYILVFSVSILAYTILRYRLLDIKIAFTRAGIFAFVYLLVLGIPFWLGFRFLGKGLWILPVSIMAVFATLGPSIYSYLRRQAENRILAEDKRAQAMLTKASKGMTSIRDLKELLNLIIYLVSKQMRVKNSSIYLLDKDTGQYLRKAIRLASQLPNPQALGQDDGLIQYLNHLRAPLVYEELKTSVEAKDQPEISSLITQMRNLNASVIVPALIEDLLIGFLVLDQRRDNRSFSQENLNVLQLLANQAALAIENAVFYEETGKSLAETFHESRLRAIGTLGAGIGHQINNRFTAIASPAQVASYKIAKRDLDSLSPQELKDLLLYSKGVLDSISQDALRGGKIATSLTSFSRKTEGYATVSFAKVIEEVLNLLSCKFQLNELNLQQDVSSDGPLLWGNLSQLDEVFFNLLDNAHDALNKKISEAKENRLNLEPDYQPQVYLQAAPLDNKILKITLRDNGIGMTKEQIDSLFIPFFTTKATAGKGTGLGLWMIKQIVEAHHGIINTESTYGQGTKFTVELPLATNEQLSSPSTQNNLKEAKPDGA